MGLFTLVPFYSGPFLRSIFLRSVVLRSLISISSFAARWGNKICRDSNPRQLFSNVYLFYFQLPREPRRHPLINILEVDDPKLGIVFHLMAPFTSLNPQLVSSGFFCCRTGHLQLTKNFSVASEQPTLAWTNSDHDAAIPPVSSRTPRQR